MKTPALALTALSTAFFAMSASATFIVASPDGLAAPGQTIGFEEVPLTEGDNVTDQFAALGVTFTPGVTYFDSVSARPNFSGPAVIDFFGADISILFSEGVTEMAAPMTANFGSMSLTALLDGMIIESFDYTFPNGTTATNPNNFFGFAGFLFDEVRLTANGNTSVAMDNLSFTVAAVPEPATLWTVLLGLLGLGFLHHRRSGAAAL